MIVRIDYPEPQVRLDLWGGTSGVFAGLDPFDRVVDQRWQNYSGTPTDLDRYQYGYDRNSNRLWKANVVGTAAVSGGLDELYAYDPLNRLTQMQRGVLNSTRTALTGTPSREMDWTLDPTGNWNAYLTKTGGATDLNQGRAQNKVNEITAVTAGGGTPLWVTPAYDAAGNTTTMPQVADPTQGFTATYDAWNRMVSVSTAAGTVATYRYDGRNRRIVKVTAATAETRHFYWTNAWQDVEERVGTSTSMDVQYAWGVRYVDELVCRDRAVGAGTERLYAMQDANFNVTAIADSTGAIAERYAFDPYGLRAVLSPSWSPLAASAYAWTVGHQGLFSNRESGLVYNRYRNLNPTLGVFLARDLLVYRGGTNLYLYVGGRPTVRLDFSGLMDFCGDIGDASDVTLGSDDFTALFLDHDRWSGTQLKGQGAKWKQLTPEDQLPEGFVPDGPYCRVYVTDDCIDRKSFHNLRSNIGGLQQILDTWNNLARSHEDQVIDEIRAVWEPPFQICDCDTSDDDRQLRAEQARRFKEFKQWLDQNHKQYFPQARDLLQHILAAASMSGTINW